MTTVLGRQLKKAMDDRDVNQVGLSVLSKIDQSTISKLVKGKVQNPGMDIVVSLAKALNMSLDQLVLGVNVREEPLLPPDEDVLLALYRSLPDNLRQLALDTLKGFSRASNKE